MAKLILLLPIFLLSLNTFSQGGDSGSGGGGPGIILKYLDDNGLVRELIVKDVFEVPPQLMDQYLDQLALRNLEIKRREFKRRVELGLERSFVNLGDAYDVTTSEGRNFDREALRSIKPSWMKEDGGDLWIDINAPVRDYQTSEGSIVEFREWLKKSAPSEPITRFPEDDEE